LRKAKSKGFKDSRVRGVKGKRISWQSSVDRIRDQDSSLKRKDFYKSTMKSIKFAGDLSKRQFRNSTLYETVDETADPVKLMLSQTPKCIL